MDDELKACPFCGNRKLNLGNLTGDDWFVECEKNYVEKRGCGMSLHAIHPTREAAIDAWNSRHESIIQEDLSMLVRMLVTKHRRGKLDEEYCQNAMDYLQRKGLQGNILRAI